MASSSRRGKALSESAKKDIKILVVGNPANTNAYIAQQNAPDLDPGRFTAMTRLDHNRAISQLAAKTGTTVNDVTNMTIWGNHSVTQYPDLFHAKVNGKNAYELVNDHAWVDGTYIPTVAKRGAAIIEARGASSAASAANAAVRPHPVVDARHRPWRLGEHGRAQRRFVRRARGSHVELPVHLRRREVLDRPGSRHRRLQPRQDRRLGPPSSPKSAMP